MLVVSVKICLFSLLVIMLLAKQEISLTWSGQVLHQEQY